MIRTDTQGRRETLATVRERINELEEQGVPLDSPLVDWLNPTYMRDEIVVEIPSPPPADLSLDDLLAEFREQVAIQHTDAVKVWNEIETRLRSRS